MANANTIQQLNNLPLQTVTTTTETAFASATSSTTRALLAMLPDVTLGLFDGRPFAIHAMLRLTAAATGDVKYTFNVYSNSGDNTNLTTFTDDTKLLSVNSGTTTYIAGTNATAFIEGIFLWDSVSEQISCISTSNSIFNVEGTAAFPAATASAAGSSYVASLVNPGSTGFQFYATTTWAVAGTNTAELVEFSLSQI